MTQGRPSVAPVEAKTPAPSPPSTQRPANQAATAAAGESARPAAAKLPHEVRAGLRQRAQELRAQRQLEVAKEGRFGKQAGDLAEKLEETTDAAQRKRLQDHLDGLEEKEEAARTRIGEIDGKLAEVNRELTELVRQGVDPTSGHIDPTSGYSARAVGSPDLVPAGRLDRPPGGILESTGAEAVKGQRIGGQRVLAAVESETAMRTHIDAGAAEGYGYRDSLGRGEIGLQRPGRINEGGLDYLTARRNPAGQIELVLNDATIDPKKRLDAVPDSWFQEAEDAIRVKPDGTTRLELHNPDLEREIREALEQGRFVADVVLVDVGPDGVRFTLLSSTPVSPPPKPAP